MLAGSIPPERTGVYMGIFNMFIVIPMLLQIYTFWQFDLYNSLMGGDPRNVLRFAGVLMFCGAVATMFVKLKPSSDSQRLTPASSHG
jgi:maltose/moltooligosaccharide transporter